MKINSIYITILLIIILILLIIYGCYYYNSKSNIENYTNLDCTNYRDGSYCKQIGEENPFWCFIKKMFCFIIYLKNLITKKDDDITNKNTQIKNLENDIAVLSKTLSELNSTIKTIEDAISKSEGNNNETTLKLIQSERDRVDLEAKILAKQQQKEELERKIISLEFDNENLIENNTRHQKEHDIDYANIMRLSTDVNNYRTRENTIIDICKIDVNNIEDEYEKNQTIINQIKQKCSLPPTTSTSPPSNLSPSQPLGPPPSQPYDDNTYQPSPSQPSQPPNDNTSQPSSSPPSQPPNDDTTQPSNDNNNQLLPGESDVISYRDECISKCIKSKCPDSNSECISTSDEICRMSCNQHNGFTLQECLEFDCKTDIIKNTIQNNYDKKMASLLGVEEVNMYFPMSKIQNIENEPLNCNVEYTYNVYDSDGNLETSGNNKRRFEFEKNLDCTYTLLNMGISQITEEDNIENRIGSTNYQLRTQNLRDQVSSSKTGRTAASTVTK